MWETLSPKIQGFHIYRLSKWSQTVSKRINKTYFSMKVLYYILVKVTVYKVLYIKYRWIYSGKTFTCIGVKYLRPYPKRTHVDR
jgi:hypothetical protein